MEINDDVLISYLLGETSPETGRQVSAWIDADPANRRRYEQFKVIWDKSRGIGNHEDPDAHGSLKRLKDKLALPDKVVPISQKGLWLKIAATILVLAGCGVFYFYQQQYGTIQFATVNEVKTDTLSDGSIVTLNKQTALTYPLRFGRNEREVSLNYGEAFFHVAKNKAKPFIIRAGGITIRVVGTSFNVKNKPAGVEVIVETGIVQVTRDGRHVSLARGEKVLVLAGSSPLKKQKTPDLLYNYYRSKQFVADNTPLRRMVETLNEAYGSKIVIARDELKELPLHTTFKDESLEDILAIISRTFGVTIAKKNDLIIIK